MSERIDCLDHTCMDMKRSCYDMDVGTCEEIPAKCNIVGGVSLEDFLGKFSCEVFVKNGYKCSVYSNRMIKYIHILDENGEVYLFNIEIDEVNEGVNVCPFYGPWYSFSENKMEEFIELIESNRILIEEKFEYVDKLARGEISDGDE